MDGDVERKSIVDVKFPELTANYKNVSSHHRDSKNNSKMTLMSDSVRSKISHSLISKYRKTLHTGEMNIDDLQVDTEFG